MNINQLIPGITDELATLWQGTSSEAKLEMNGFLPEQRVFIAAEHLYEPLKGTDHQDAFLAGRMYLDARKLLIKFGEAKVLPLKPELQPVFDAVNNLKVCRKLTDVIKIWSPDWESIINGLVSEEYEFGQNRFMIIGYKGDGQRPSIRIISRVIGTIDESSPGYNPYLPKFNIGDETLINTLQLEQVLNRRVD